MKTVIVILVVTVVAKYWKDLILARNRMLLELAYKCASYARARTLRLCSTRRKKLLHFDPLQVSAISRMKHMFVSNLLRARKLRFNRLTQIAGRRRRRTERDVGQAKVPVTHLTASKVLSMKRLRESLSSGVDEEDRHGPSSPEIGRAS